MPNLALYRKYRPDNFEEVSGQETITRILKNQIAMDRVGHAYLFSGIRGTGKTTIAKIFARAVNCEHPINGSPCAECETCRALIKPGNMDIIEIDAASNRGVDEIRNLRETVTYAPTSGKYKVYIIDEVHMLTKEAFNALLKTLEEPPEHAIFILATTEPAKLPATILSRCQIFGVKPISFPVISNRLKEVVSREGVAIEEGAIEEIAARSGHSMRDALSLLDQCIDLRLPGETISSTDVADFLGISPEGELQGIVRAVSKRDSSELLSVLEHIRAGGREEALLLEDLSKIYQELLYFKLTGTGEENRKDFFLEMAPVYDTKRLYEIIDKLVEVHAKLRYNQLAQVLTDTALLSLCAEPEVVSQAPIAYEPVQSAGVGGTQSPSQWQSDFGQSHMDQRQPDYNQSPVDSGWQEPPQAPVEPSRTDYHQSPVDSGWQDPPQAQVEQRRPEPQQSFTEPRQEPPKTKSSSPEPTKKSHVAKAGEKPRKTARTIQEEAIQVARQHNETLITMLFEKAQFVINRHGLFLIIDDRHEFMFNTDNFPQKLQRIVDIVMGEHTKVYPKLKSKYVEHFGKKEPSLEEQVRAVVGDDVIYEKAEEKDL